MTQQQLIDIEYFLTHNTGQAITQLFNGRAEKDITDQVIILEQNYLQGITDDGQTQN